MRKRSFVVAVVFLFFACLGFADLVYLKSGKTIEGEVISETEEKVTLRLPMGKRGDIVYTLEKNEILKIEKAPVSYDFFTEEELDIKTEEVKGNKFSPENIIKKILAMFNSEKTNKKEVNVGEVEKRIRNYVASSGFMGFISNFLLIGFAVCTFNVFRKDTDVFASKLDEMTISGIFGRWFFFLGGLVFVQFQRVGSFDFIGSGFVSIFFLAVICYETLGFFTLLFFRKKYKDFISEGKIFNVMIFKMPIACEFTLFAYLILMKIFTFFI